MPDQRVYKMDKKAICAILLFGLVLTAACGGTTPTPTPMPTPLPPTATPEPGPPIAAPTTQARDTVVMTTGEWAPFSSESLDGLGFFTEIVTAVFDEMGMTPQYEFYPWQRAEQAVADGAAWAAFPYSYNEERALTFTFSDPVASSTTLLFYYKPHMESVEWEELEDLQPYRVGGVLGYFYESMLNEAGLTTDYASSEELAIKKLQAERVDLLPMNNLVAWNHIRALFPDQVQDFGTLEKPLSENALHLMILKDSPESLLLMEQFNAALQAIRDKGIYQEILTRYGILE